MEEDFSCTVLDADSFHSPLSANIDDNEMCSMDDDTSETCIGAFETSRCYAQRVSVAEYNKQTNEYTKSALQSLVSSPEYQRIYTRCRLCWCSWSEDYFNEGCSECGGFAMTRPCPICNGRCSAIWMRDVELSHSNNEAYWNGECRLPPDAQQGFLAQLLISGNVNEQDILDGLQDLTAQ